MQINISNIPEEGLRLHFSRSGDWFFRFLPDSEKEGFSPGEISVRCFVEKTLKNIFVKGEVETVIRLTCCRCLEEFDLPLAVEFEYTLVPVVDDPKEDVELAIEDLESGYYRGNTIDLGEIVVEQIVLQIPIKPLCSDSCKGLCPVCGINLNTESCDHEAGHTDSPFAVLKNFKAKKGI